LDWRTKTLLQRSVPVVKSEVADPSGVLGAAALAFDAVALRTPPTPGIPPWHARSVYHDQ